MLGSEVGFKLRVAALTERGFKTYLPVVSEAVVLTVANRVLLALVSRRWPTANDILCTSFRVTAALRESALLRQQEARDAAGSAVWGSRAVEVGRFR